MAGTNVAAGKITFQQPLYQPLRVIVIEDFGSCLFAECGFQLRKCRCDAPGSSEYPNQLAFLISNGEFAERAGTPEISSFARSIIQADQFGISLGRILRVQASESRLRRQAAAEERAMKAPIKMLFPTVMFIFPAMFVVTLGPAFLQIRKVL